MLALKTGEKIKNVIMGVDSPLSGKRRWISINASPIFTKNNTINEVFTTFDDVTELFEKEILIQKKSERIHTIANFAPVAIFETDAEGKCNFVNEYWRKLTGLSDEESFGDQWINAIYYDDREKVFYEWGEAVKAERPFYLEYRIQHKNNEIRWVVGNAYAIRNDKQLIVGFLGSIQDITSLKNVQNELVEAKKTAEKLSQVKSEFLASMSHEIRTPLNGVLGTAGLLQLTELSEEQKEYVHIILRSGEGLLTIINDILDISKIESGKFELDRRIFNLKTLFEDVVLLLQPIADKKSLGLFLNSNSEIKQEWLGDPNRIKQIILNIVGNAVKFTKKGQVEIVVEYWIEHGVKKGIRFDVKDSGIGISEENLKNLFQNFVQGDKKIQSEFGGTGLGLSISKKLAELMGGTILVTSQLGAGTTFSIFLGTPSLIEGPFESIHNRAIDETNPFKNSIEDLSHFKILIAEDNVVNQKVIKSFLTKMGYKSLIVVENGEEAINVFRGEQVDLILMDCFMPIMDGYQASREIRQYENDKGLKPIPIIAVTANAMLEDQKKCFDSGMSDYVTKPINASSLSNVLKKWLGPTK